jgi:flagellar hook-basal body complex protein FliE
MPVSALSGIAAAIPTAALPGVSAPTATGGANFGNALTSAIDDLQSAQQTSNQLAIKAVTGDLTDNHDATIAATRAQVTLELVSAVRNKGVEAFNDIMRMQA